MHIVLASKDIGTVRQNLSGYHVLVFGVTQVKMFHAQI